MLYGYEYPRRLRIGHVGAGGHSFRNILPAYRYAPVELAALCDLDVDRARKVGTSFGQPRVYGSMTEMLDKEELDAVFLVVGYLPDGRPAYPALARQAMEAGCHVWMEKPPAASSQEIAELEEVAARTGRTVLVGFKKMFTPCIQRAWEILQLPEFGAVTSIYVRYPQSLPRERDSRSMRGFLDHIVHPASIIRYLMGPVGDIAYRREPRQGASAAVLTFTSGAVGLLHLAAGQSGTSFLERVEVVGEGTNLVVDNGVRLTYYRRGGRGPYGRSPSFLTELGTAPLVWEPEFSLGQLYNSNLFTLGYVQEIVEFCQAVLEGRPPDRAGLDHARDILRIYEVFLVSA